MLPLLKGFGNAKPSTRGLPCTHAGDIGAPSAGNAGFVVIQTHLSVVRDHARQDNVWHGFAVTAADIVSDQGLQKNRG